MDTDVNNDNRSLGEIVQELLQDTTKLFQKEVQLAKTELQQKAGRVAKDSAKLIAGGVLAYTGAIILLFSLVMALALIMPTWLSALIVGAVVTIIGVILLQNGLNDMKKINPMPEETIETIREDGALIKEKIKNG